MVVYFSNKRLTYALKITRLIAKILLQVRYLSKCELWILPGCLDVKRAYLHLYFNQKLYIIPSDLNRWGKKRRESELDRLLMS